VADGELAHTHRPPKVSRRHAAILVHTNGVFVENLSRYGTRVNRARIETPTRIEDGDWLQIGGVLLRAVIDLDPTESAEGPMSVEELDSTDPPSSEPGPLAPGIPSPILAYDDDALCARFFGHPVELTPLSLGVLECLAAEPSCWVSTDDILEAVWPDNVAAEPAYVSKYVSYIRSALADVIGTSSELEALIREALIEHRDTWSASEDDIESMELAALMRELIKSRKRVGFRILLDPDDVQGFER